MKNFLKKIHSIGIGSNKLEDHSEEGCNSTSTRTTTSSSSSSSSSSTFKGGNDNKSTRLNDGQISKSEHKPPFQIISGWLHSVTNRQSSSNSSPSTSSPSPSSSSPNVVTGGGGEEACDYYSSVGGTTSSSLDAAAASVRDDDAVAIISRHDYSVTGSTTNSRGCSDRDVALEEEEHQIQLALELSAREDPEAFQIEAVKQISLGSLCPPENTPAEVVAYRYWNYNALSYDDKILDGFYDLYGILTESASSRMPSLVDLQGTSFSDNIRWEAIVVNKAADTKLLNLEQKAFELAFKFRSHSVNIVSHVMVKKLATLVSDYMGGPVGDPDNIKIVWRNFSHNLKANLGSMVLPLGSLTIGLACHRALLFKVLADSVSIPCRLVKGQQFTGSDDVAINFVKIDGGREYIVDLMADPGTLIPSDAGGAHVEHPEENSESKFNESSGMRKESVYTGERLSSGSVIPPQLNARGGFENDVDGSVENSSNTFNHPYSHARSPSWTEGVSSPAVRRMKVKDVSKYMIDAAKENPQLAQKLHDVLLESGVVAPPNLFSEMYPEQLDFDIIKPLKDKKVSDDKHKTKVGYTNNDQAFLPPLPYHRSRAKPLEVIEQHHHVSSDSESEYQRNIPVAAAAAAAAVVASSMVVAAATKANIDPKLQRPVATAATATAAAVVATTVAVNKQYGNALQGSPDNSTCPNFSPAVCVRNDVEADIPIYEHRGCGSGDHEGSSGLMSEGERISDRSTGNESSKSDVTLEDVADCEIPWEDITLGERIGLGSYGEVYHGDWHGTEVAVKKFLDQDLTGESVEEFKSEVLIMKRVRHPNVVLFMGAITRPPNLSIVTEFLPRGSLYRLIRRPNNQLDERRRLRMALDAARGMNYLHNCSPVIVHRDLKSPNLLVDKNWVVKVCDFGLSRMKHSTFLSSRSAAGTAEWMAPEVLRNEPSNEKCDVYSYGVILWELFTLQQPWGGMNPMQVVGAVGFQNRRLDIPNNMDPVVADIISKCWQTDPNLRPSFAEIMAALKPLQKPLSSSSQVRRLIDKQRV